MQLIKETQISPIESEVLARISIIRPILTSLLIGIKKDVLDELQQGITYTGENILYVLTNQIRSFGASVILYDGCLEMIGKYLGDNYFVLPSSIHEVIIMPEKKAPWGGVGLSEMVQEINRTQVDDEDVLSDYAYYYDCEKKKLL